MGVVFDRVEGTVLPPSAPEPGGPPAAADASEPPEAMQRQLLQAQLRHCQRRQARLQAN